ncbi:MAG: AAA family ATPase [Phaeodactylibacter sp.]|nr:AAA family ATPase [Phaeodactylibacter sp.]MCB9294656.1 AAA family ATPase [Lewinellaceae bacterium]
MSSLFTGREKERAILKELLNSGESEFVAVYGRRRVGKTFLVETVYQDQIVFEITGLNKASKEMQLENFANLLNARLRGVARMLNPPKSWLQAFFKLQEYLETLKRQGKLVIFIDELPWLATGKSGFLQALENFWNSWASKRNDVILVVCGSAASWMISNVVKSKGGLHNRITRRIRLLPFNLCETESYLRNRGIKLDRYSILQLYMAMGGIPHYLKEIRKGKSAMQVIDEVCFTKDGLLFDEFKNLYEALYSKPERYISIIQALANKPKGMTRNEIIETCKLSSGGTTTRVLDSLEESGFIMHYLPVGKNAKLALYKLTDPYSAFYLKFIAGTRTAGEGTWVKKSATPSWRSWSGFAFERLCFSHIAQIKKALGISGVYTEESAWAGQEEATGAGAQIDLLIDRADNVINVCEIKFSQNPFAIDKKYAAELRNKLFAFRQNTKTRKTLFLTMITTFGLAENQYSTSMVEQSLDMDALFEQ